jgi:hypothetical protein
MDPVLKALFEQWGVESEAALIAKKSAEEQRKDYFSQGPQRAKLSAVECESLCRKNKVKYKPGYEDRVLEFTISTEKTDDGGDIMNLAGCDMSRFDSNPIVHYNHKTNETPVANCLKCWVTPNKEMKALALFADTEDDPSRKSDQIFRMADAGFIRGASIGFIPVKTVRPETAEERSNMKLGPYGLFFEKWKMTEWSVCNVPMNQEAIQSCMKALGAEKPEDLFFVKKKEPSTVSTTPPVQPWQPPAINITLNLDWSKMDNLTDKLESLSVQLKQLPLTLLNSGGQSKSEKSMYDIEQHFPSKL